MNSQGRAVIGIHSVREALKVSEVGVLWLKMGWKDNADLVKLEELARSKGVKVEERSMGQLSQVAESHQGACAIVESEPEWDWKQIESEKCSRLIFLDGVEDPHNLGAVLRTSWLLGVKSVFIPEVRAASLSPAASKVAQGAAEHVPVVEGNLADEIATAKKLGFWVYGLSNRGSKSIYDVRLPEKVAWVLGSEAAGIRIPIERQCDELVGIPQLHSDASFNVSVAAAIALGETFRQHQIFEKSGK